MTRYPCQKSYRSVHWLSRWIMRTHRQTWLAVFAFISCTPCKGNILNGQNYASLIYKINQKPANKRGEYSQWYETKNKINDRNFFRKRRKLQEDSENCTMKSFYPSPNTTRAIKSRGINLGQTLIYVGDMRNVHKSLLENTEKKGTSWQA